MKLKGIIPWGLRNNEKVKVTEMQGKNFDFTFPERPPTVPTFKEVSEHPVTARHKKGLMVESPCMKSVDSSELTVLQIDILEEASY